MNYASAGGQFELKVNKNARLAELQGSETKEEAKAKAKAFRGALQPRPENDESNGSFSFDADIDGFQKVNQFNSFLVGQQQEEVNYAYVGVEGTPRGRASRSFVHSQGGISARSAGAKSEKAGDDGSRRDSAASAKFAVAINSDTGSQTQPSQDLNELEEDGLPIGKSKRQGKKALEQDHPSGRASDVTGKPESGEGALEDAGDDALTVRTNYPAHQAPKMNTFQAYFALMKAYCAINVLLLPMAFRNGGWALSPCSLIVACIFEATCAIKLAQCGLFTGTISYQTIVCDALGAKFHKFFIVIIGLVQFQFTISQLAFIVQSVSDSVHGPVHKGDDSLSIEELHDIQVFKYKVAFVILIVFAPLTWVRDLERFRFGLIFGVVMIFVTCFVISVFDITAIAERDSARPTSGYEAINDETYFDMIGFSFFMFEGIGAVMPVMNACSPEVHQKFPYILTAALGTLCTLYIVFSEINYYTFGNGLNQPIVMGMMPADNPIIQIVKVLFSANIVFSYPITIFPTNQILDEMLLSRFPANSTYRVFLFRLICTTVLVLGLVAAIQFYHDLDKILATTGVAFGTFVVLFVPSLCHYRLIATHPKFGSKRACHIDLFIITYSVCMCFAILLLQILQRKAAPAH